MSSLSDLTIIIFTYNRHRYVLRNLELWSNRKAIVHILDGTDEPLSGELLANFTSNIKYHHLPVSIWDRISRGADMVVTKYVAFLADDEFFLPSAVEASISELDKNQELVACCGRWIDKCLTAELIVSEGAIEGNKLNYQRGSSGAVEHDDSIERMICHMNPYVPSAFYAVCRSAEWKKAVGAFTKRQFSSGLVAELQFELSMSFFGKIKVIDELMWLRTAENPSNTEGFELEFHSWFTNALYAQEVDDFLSMTARNMVGAGPQDFHSVREGLARACLAYVAYCAGNDVSGRSGQTTSITKARAASKGSALLKRTIKKISSRLPSPLTALLPVRLRFRPYVEIAKGLESLGLRVDWNQLFIILETVKKSHVATS